MEENKEKASEDYNIVQSIANLIRQERNTLAVYLDSIFKKNIASKILRIRVLNTTDDSYSLFYKHNHLDILEFYDSFKDFPIFITENPNGYSLSVYDSSNFIRENFNNRSFLVININGISPHIFPNPEPEFFAVVTKEIIKNNSTYLILNNRLLFTYEADDLLIEHNEKLLLSHITYDVSKKYFLIGRTKECDLKIKIKDLNNEQFKVFYENGMWIIECLDKRTGVLRIENSENIPINSEATYKLFGVIFKIWQDYIVN